MLLDSFYAFTTALCAALIMVPFLRRWAHNQGTVDLPDERKVHGTPTPRLGGIAIFLAFLFSTLIFAPPAAAAFRGVLTGALVIFAVGIADDLYGLTSRQKFLGQVVACLVTIAVGNLWLHDLGNLFGLGDILLPVWAGVPFTVFAVVGVTNAINLIDGLDGLAGGVSVLALAAFALLGLLDGNHLAALLSMALAGSILGFLKYNFYPALIFMGDAGSLTVGYLLGFLAVMLTQGAAGGISPMLPVLILGLPLFDAVWVMTRRLLNHTGPFSPDRTHVHHKFLDLGVEHRLTVLVIYAISLFWACSALLLRNLPEYALLIFLIVTAGSSYLLIHHLLRHRARYPFLARDTQETLRASVTFNRYADFADRTLPLLAVLCGFYALLGAGYALANGVQVWPMALVLLFIGAGLRRWGRDGGEFQLLLVYAAACLLAFVVWQQGEGGVLGFSPKRIGDTLLLAAALLVGVKLLFRRSREFFLGTADALALALMIFLIIATQQPGKAGVSLGGPLLRAILLVLATRILASHGPKVRQQLINASLLFLAILAISGLWVGG